MMLFMKLIFYLQRTALHWSAYCGNLENVKLLVKNKSNCGNPDVEGKTPIHWAASSQSPDAADCIKVLLVIMIESF